MHISDGRTMQLLVETQSLASGTDIQCNVGQTNVFWNALGRNVRAKLDFRVTVLGQELHVNLDQYVNIGTAANAESVAEVAPGIFLNIWCNTANTFLTFWRIVDVEEDDVITPAPTSLTWTNLRPTGHMRVIGSLVRENGFGFIMRRITQPAGSPIFSASASCIAMGNDFCVIGYTAAPWLRIFKLRDNNRWEVIPLSSAEAPEGTVNRVACTPDGSVIACTSTVAPFVVILREQTNGTYLRAPITIGTPALANNLTDIDISHDGLTVAFGQTVDPWMRVYRAANNTAANSRTATFVLVTRPALETTTAASAPVRNLKLSNDGLRLVFSQSGTTALNNQSIILAARTALFGNSGTAAANFTSMGAAGRIVNIRRQQNNGERIAFTANGNGVVVITDQAPFMRMWDVVGTGTSLSFSLERPNIVAAETTNSIIAFSRDGRLMLARGTGANAQIFAREAASESMMLIPHPADMITEGALSMAISPDCRYVGVVASGGLVRMFQNDAVMADFVPATGITVTSPGVMETGSIMQINTEVEGENPTVRFVRLEIVDDGGTGATLLSQNLIAPVNPGVIRMRAVLVDGGEPF